MTDSEERKIPYGLMKVNPLKGGGATVTIHVDPDVWEQYIEQFKDMQFGMVSIRKFDPTTGAIMEPMEIDNQLSGLEMIERAEQLHKQASELYQKGVTKLRATVEPLLKERN